MIAGLALGGMLTTGQVDPGDWLPSQCVAMIALAGAACGSRMRAWPLLICGLAGTLSSTVLLCGVASKSWPWVPAGILAGASVQAMLGAWLLSWRGVVRWSGGLCLVLLAAVLIGQGRSIEAPASGAKPPLAVLSALPLFWDDKGSGLREPAPAMIALRRRFAVVPIDAADGGRLSPYGRLLLAQPRLLAPVELVAIDAWVRAGGRAVILADPLLGWPIALPAGDRRRPPITSLLDPLLTHWGLRLEPVDGDGAGQSRRFLATGALLPLADASRFSKIDGTCGLIESGLMALCRIGRGQVRLVADADLLDDRLWLSDPDRPGSRAALTGDTIELLAAWLDAPVDSAARPVSHVIWVRDDAALLSGVRWALVVGMIWVVLGIGVILSLERERDRRDPTKMPQNAEHGTNEERHR